ncbi:MAG TPA: GNAT family N-acetyltransferase [Lacisediminihabitans sp.]|uniref:GNAT family N-acetyltransferase n=1 Tax=Lacisediminihabitans sp. TaxID=2787631 RepID=UPI002EDA8EDB
MITDRITVGAFDTHDDRQARVIAAEVQRHIERSRAKIIILRYPADFVSLLKSVDIGTRSVYPGGSLAYWEACLADSGFSDPDVLELGAEERHSWMGEVESVIADSFLGYINHYASNPLISSDLIADGYAEWARSTLNDSRNRLFVVNHEARVAGLAVVHVDGDIWDIELASIATPFQRRGLYLRLVRQILDEGARTGVSQLVISTQSHNIAVQRAWIKLGFRPIASIETVHLVDGNPPALS